MAKIYVASSWRNRWQPEVIQKLRLDGHDVYDFRDSEGFHWQDISPNWEAWSPQEYIGALSHHLAHTGFTRDMEALKNAAVCVLIMPCGMSAGIEFGFAVGVGMHTCVYVAEESQPDLMISAADFISPSLWDIRQWIKGGCHATGL